MENWKKVKLSEVANIIGGGTPKSDKEEYFKNGNIAWLTPKDLSGYNKRYISKGERNITELGLNNSSAKLLPKGTVLFTSRAPIGYVAIAENEVTTNQGFKSLVLKDGNVPEFFYYLLKQNTPLFEARATGSTFKEVSGQIMKDTEFNIPDIETQKKIVNLISPLDQKIELNNAINHTLEQIAQTIFKSWFIDFDPVHAKANALANGQTTEQAELAAMSVISGKNLEELHRLQTENPEQYQQLAETAKAFPSEFEGEVPKGWEIRKVAEIAKFVKGKKPKNLTQNPKDGFLPHILMSSLDGKYTEYAQTDKAIICNVQDTLILMDGAASGKIAIGHNGIVGSTFAKMELKDTKLWALFNQFMKEKESDIQANTTGTSIPHTDKNRVLDYEFIIPDSVLLDEFSMFYQYALDKVRENIVNSITLENIKIFLLPKLLNGYISSNGEVNYE